MHSSLERNGWWLTRLEGDNLDGLLDLSRELGMPIGGRKKGKLIEILKPHCADSINQNSLSNRFQLSAFPYHADTAHWVIPSRYMVLGCKQPGSCGRKTVLIDWKKIEFGVSEVNLLRRAVFLIKNGRNSFYSTILNQDEEFFRFDPGCMTPVDNDAGHALNLVEDKLRDIEPLEVSWRKGDVLVVDNWRMLHGRGYAENKSAYVTTRELHRVLVS